jgi:cytochrome bd ubiquinol oxidase subunit II
VGTKRLFGAAFAFSALVTPFFLGTVAGAVASGRVPPGSARGDPLTSWWNPTSVLGGAMAVGVCAYLAAVYLTADAERAGQAALAERFRRRALGTGVAVGAVALAGIGVLAADASRLYQGLTGRALPLIAASAAFGLASLALLWRRQFLAVRVTAACAVVAVVWGWAVGQYPYMLEPDLTIAAAAAGRATLQAMLAALGVGAVLLVPSLAWLFILFQRTDPPPAAHTRRPQGS